MAAPAHILELPQELIVRVGYYLTTVELGLFRRSCSHIETHLFESFAAEFFTKRQFMIEQVSLEALVGIATHPNLSKYLTEVIISTQSFAMTSSNDAGLLGLGRITREMLIHSGQARDMLAEAFSNLPNLCIVGLRDYNGKGRYRDGPAARWQTWGWSLCPSPAEWYYNSPGPYFALITSALAVAKKGPQRFDVFCRRNLLLKPDSFGYAAHSPDPSMKYVLESLRVLRLALCFKDNLPFENTLTNSDALCLPLRRFLQRTSNLDSLRLNFASEDLYVDSFLDCLCAPISSCPTPLLLQNLSVLELGMATVSASNLIKVLTTFNLKSFSLWKITLKSLPLGLRFDCWADFLSRLAATMPSPSPIRTIMIGRPSQNVNKFSHARNPIVGWVPLGTAPEKRHEVVHWHNMNYLAQFTAISADQWLQQLSQQVYLPGYDGPGAWHKPDSEEDQGGTDQNAEDSEGSDAEMM